MSQPYIHAVGFQETKFNPFPGLRAFEPDEDYLFFGREQQTDELLRKLRTTRFLAILGRSGSGKSSLVRSGLIPSLYGGAMTRAGSTWCVAIMRPGEDPLGNLADALSAPDALGALDGDAALTRDFFDTTLRASQLGLVECIHQARMPAGANLLVLVDQFEEIFRYRRSRRIVGRDEAVAFVKLLLAARDAEVSCYVAITMRSDFIGDCMEFGTLPEAINNGIYLVPRMTRDELRSAIVGPVAVGGATMAPRLVSRLLNDVGDDPDQLPILQHALMRTWERWEANHGPGEPLDLRHYEDIGGMSMALSRHAEEAFADLDERGKEIAEKLFKALTDKGSDARGVRRPAPVSEICAMTGTSLDEVTHVVDAFRKPGRSFLMPIAGVPLRESSILDISHESLMRVWERLSRWAMEEARSAQLYLNVARAAQRHEEGAAALWRDPELQLALTWRNEERPTEGWAARYDPSFARAMAFLDASKAERDRDAAEREARRRHSLRQARVLSVILGTAMVVTLALGAFAFIQKINAVAAEHTAEQALLDARQAQSRTIAEKQKVEQEARRAAEARGKAEQQSQRAESERLRAEREAQRAEREAARAESERQNALASEREARRNGDAAEAARNQAVAEKTMARAEQARAETSEQESRRLGHLAAVRALSLIIPQRRTQPQSTGLLALEAYRLNRENGGKPYDPDLFAAMRTALERLRPAAVVRMPHAVLSLAVAGDGRTAFAGDDDGGVLRLPLEGGGAPAAVGSVAGPVRTLALRSAGDLLAAGTTRGSITLFDVRSASGRTREIAVAGAPISSLAFQPGGTLLAVGSLDGSATLVDVEHPDRRTPLLPKSPNRVRAVAFGPHGAVAVGRQTGGALLWNAADVAAGPKPVCEQVADVRSLAFRADGKSLACGGHRGQTSSVSLEPGGSTMALPEHASSVNALSFGPAGTLATASSDATIRIWPLTGKGPPPVVLPGHESWVWAVAYSPDGNYVISAGEDRTVRIWGARTDILAADLCRYFDRLPQPKPSIPRDDWNRFIPADLPYNPTPACGEGS